MHKSESKYEKKEYAVMRRLSRDVKTLERMQKQEMRRMRKHKK